MDQEGHKCSKLKQRYNYTKMHARSNKHILHFFNRLRTGKHLVTHTNPTCIANVESPVRGIRVGLHQSTASLR